MRVSTVASISVLVIVGFSAGCVSTGRDFDTSQVSTITKGKTTESEMIQRFGEPQTRSTSASGDQILAWSSGHAQGGFMGIGRSSSLSRLQATIHDGVVTDYNMTSTNQ